MSAVLTRDQAREQVARAIHDVQCVGRCEWAGAVDPWHPMRLRLADAALTVLWPVVEGLRAERDEARENAVDAVRLIERMSHEGRGCATVPIETFEAMQNPAPDDAPGLRARVERRAQRDAEARDYEAFAAESRALAEAPFVAVEKLQAEVERLRAELAHAHTVIARHVEPKRGAVIDRHCCDTCETRFLDAEVERTGNPSMRLMRFMVVCSACGSKRCPRAADHDLACEADQRGEEAK